MLFLKQFFPEMPISGIASAAPLMPLQLAENGRWQEHFHVTHALTE
ncbi:hypothetical protein SXCC_04233 [Gluconacetobacter sp. SXCC-1]|nr:hypothetical protein SXCC_04233 [Gluconacetobacter sp. SXCC-1]